MASTTKQPSLFDDDELAPDKNLLRIDTLNTVEMSPAQKKFNSAAKKLEKLRGEILDTTRNLDFLLSFWVEMVSPLIPTLNQRRFSLATILDSQVKKKTFSQQHELKISTLILDLLDDAFCDNFKAPEADALWNRWSRETYSDYLSSQILENAEECAQTYQQIFGVPIDAETFQQGPKAIKLAIQAQLMKIITHRQSLYETRQSQKQAEEQAELTQRSIRSVYLSLVKALPPDLVTNPTQNQQHETFMREVTSAYENKDLHTLLKLENEWVTREGSHLAQADEETIVIYTTVLCEQVAELEHELMNLPAAERYTPIHQHLATGVERTHHLIQQENENLTAMIADLDSLIAAVQSGFSMTLVTKIKKDLYGPTARNSHDLLLQMSRRVL